MERITEKTAEYLLQIKAIKLQPSNPFTWASGLKSPIYCDNRKTLSFPEIRSFIRDSFISVIREHYPGTEIIAGVATGAIAHAALVADKLDLPFIYVRSGAKEHGLGNRIEGYYEHGQKAVVIEDLVSTGGSSLNVVTALRDAGVDVEGMLAIFTYGFAKARERFENEKCDLHTLCDYSALIEIALSTGYIGKEEMDTLNEWRKDPAGWGTE